MIFDLSKTVSDLELARALVKAAKGVLEELDEVIARKSDDALLEILGDGAYKNAKARKAALAIKVRAFPESAERQKVTMTLADRLLARDQAEDRYKAAAIQSQERAAEAGLKAAEAYVRAAQATEMAVKAYAAVETRIADEISRYLRTQERDSSVGLLTTRPTLPSQEPTP